MRINFFYFTAFFVCLTTSFLFSVQAAEKNYAVKTKRLYSSFDKGKAIGKMYPMADYEVLENKGDVDKILVTGFVKKGVSRAVYLKPGKRILLIALKKKSGVKQNVTKTLDLDGDTWEEVSVTLYTDAGDKTSNFEELSEKADGIFVGNCASCHSLPIPKKYTANQWPSIVKAKKTKTSLNSEQSVLLLEYLQRRSKDLDS